MLENFKDGKFNVIIMTSVGELGLDIPAVDLIVFYEPVPSAIRQIQRRGRTSRHKDGKLKVLVTKGTRDEAYRWSAHHKEKRMHTILSDLKNKIQLNKGQKSLASFGNKLKVFADSRERSSGILKLLADKNVELKLQNMEVGDFILSERVCVERKEVKDFVDSIIDKRILKQVQELKNNFERPLIVIEGIENIYSVRNIHSNAIRGMLAYITVDLGIPIVYTRDSKDTVEFLLTVAKREQEKGKKEFSLRGEKKPLTLKEQQEFVVGGFPGVGGLLAKNLLKEFGSVKSVVNASVEELKDVDKIGKKKAEEIRKVLDEGY
jgi:Fanconi anemia group M protein